MHIGGPNLDASGLDLRSRQPKHDSPTMERRHVLLGSYFAVCMIALIWPVYPMIGNRATPLIFGLPPSFAYSIMWVLLTFVAMLSYHLATGEEG